MEQLTVQRFKPYRYYRWLRSAYLWDRTKNPYLDKYNLNIQEGTEVPADVVLIPFPHAPGNEARTHRDSSIAIGEGHRGLFDYRDTPVICDSSLDYAHLDLPMRKLLSLPQVRYLFTGVTFRDPAVYTRKAWNSEYYGSVLNKRMFYGTGTDIREEREPLPAEIQSKIKQIRPTIQSIDDSVLEYINLKYKPLAQRNIPISFSGRIFYHIRGGTTMPTWHRKQFELVWDNLKIKDKQFLSSSRFEVTEALDRRLKYPLEYPFEYFNLLLNTKVVISPWGWSPWCIRDLEALACGCIVIKPECSNIQTYPDIYNPKYQLMVWTDIMFEGLADQVDYILNNLEQFEERAVRGRKLIYNVMYPNDKVYQEWTPKIRQYLESCLEPSSYAEAGLISDISKF